MVLAALAAVLSLLPAAAAAGVAVVVGGPAATARALPLRPATAAGGVPAPSSRDEALTAVLNRRVTALRDRDRAAFLADVHPGDPAFTRRQETVYQNMVRLPLLGLEYRLNRSTGYDHVVPADLRGRYPADGLRAPAVTVTYRIEGVDAAPVAVPWVPVFVAVAGRWLIAGEVSDRSLPSGVGGQPWDAAPIVVVNSTRVVAVFSAGSRDNQQRLLRLAEQALDRVAVVRPTGWVGKILVVAVRDRAVFDAYFAGTPARVDQVAAIAVPHYDEVHGWGTDADYTATRIIFNPDELNEDATQLGDDLTHEFTHAAMAPVTSGWTPTWLVEGFAEYVSYRHARIAPGLVRQGLKGVTVDDLKAGAAFYAEPANYLTGWLACRLVAERYGEARLIALYEGFQSTSSEEVVVGRVLGISRAALVGQWRAYVDAQR